MRAFEDFPVGLEMALGPYAVTREETLAFAREFDPLPFHTDEAVAASSLLGGLSASGWHTCAMMMRMMVDGFLRDSTSQGSPGVDFVDWLAPVRPGDTLSGTMTVMEARPSQSRPTLGIAKLRNELRNQAGLPVLEGEYTVMFKRREAA